MTKRLKNRNERSGAPIAKRSQPFSASVFTAAWRPYFWLALWVCLLYGRTLGFGFTDFDDQAFTGNPTLMRFADIPRTFAHSASADSYRPVLFVTAIINNALFGAANAGAYHGVNMALHAAAACLAFVLLLELGVGRSAALCLAVFFAAHPLATQAVAWIPGRNDPLVTIFILWAVVALIRYAREQKTAWLAAHGAAFFAALLSKETAIAVPVVGFAYLVFLRGEKPLSRLVVVSAALWLVLCAAYLALRVFAPTDAPAQASAFRYVTGLPALAETWRFLPEIIGKTILPAGKSPFAQWSLVTTVSGVAAFAAFFWAIWELRGKPQWARLAAFGVIWMVAFAFVPMLRYHAQQSRDYDYLEHRAYCSLAGLLCFAAALWESRPARSKSRRHIAGAFAGITAAFAVSAFLYAGRFTDAETFWRSLARERPESATACNGVGVTLYASQKPDSALPYFRRATELAPESARFWNSLGAAHLRLKRYGAAHDEFLRALSLDSADADALCNLGMTTQILGNDDSLSTEQARVLYERAVAANPLHANAYVRLVIAGINQSRTDEALRWVQAARRRGIDIGALRPDVAKFLPLAGR